MFTPVWFNKGLDYFNFLADVFWRVIFGGRWQMADTVDPVWSHKGLDCFDFLADVFWRWFWRRMRGRTRRRAAEAADTMVGGRLILEKALMKKSFFFIPMQPDSIRTSSLLNRSMITWFYCLNFLIPIPTLYKIV